MGTAKSVSAGVEPCVGPGIFPVKGVRALIAHRIDLAPVIAPALVWITEHGKGCGDALELLLRLWIVLVLVGMQIFGELAVSAPDVVIRRGAFDAKNCVEVLIHGALSDGAE